jgi:nucleotide-binding universal stress UspA family protein
MGTILCAVDRSEGAETALVVARDLSTQLGARLVVAHVADGFEAPGAAESLSGVQAKQGAERLLQDLVRKHALGGEIDRRSEVGVPAERLARIAAEEGADVIIVGATARGRRGGKLVSGLAAKLTGATQRPVVVVPPQSR